MSVMPDFTKYQARYANYQGNNIQEQKDALLKGEKYAQKGQSYKLLCVCSVRYIM